LTYDFGIEVGGLVSLKYSATGAGSIGLAFTEAKNWIGEWSDSSNGGFKGPDGAVYVNFSGAGEGSYTMPDKSLRGGFRYLVRLRLVLIPIFCLPWGTKQEFLILLPDPLSLY
jgi:hypothetical protein